MDELEPNAGLTIMGRGEPPGLMKGHLALDRSLAPTLSQGGEGANERYATFTLELSEQERERLEEFRSAHQTQVLTLFFSDLVGSTRLQSDLGNLRAAELVQRHYELVRQVLALGDGREIKTAGDSMMLAFAAPSEAVRFALGAQRAMRQARGAEPLLPAMRCGLHQGQVVMQREEQSGRLLDVYGLQVSTAARIMDLASGGQILMSRTVFDDARAILRPDDLPELSPLTWLNHGPYRFKGVDDAHEVCEVGETGLAPLNAPPAGAKGWPADAASEELGWRPALDTVVPGSNWRLVNKLGEGGFGEVWQAHNPSDQSEQVFKFCFKRDRLPALKREARLLKRLRRYAHPNIVQVFDLTEGERPPHYLEMEFVDGPSLGEWLQALPPLNERLEVIAQVADALDLVHAAGIFHRDVKPSNILLTRRDDGAWQAKLTDFGLGAAEDPQLLQSIVLAEGEPVAGTWDYLAPELRRGAGPSAQSDIYSLGLTLYQAVLGDASRPLTADWSAQILSEILREDIARCVCQNPEDRWPRAAALAQALRGHDQRLRAAELQRQQQVQRERARRLRRIATITSAMVLVTLILGGFAAYQWREAAVQRDRAVAQKRLALEAINQLTHDVPQRLRDIPGTLPALKAILERNITMLDRILALEPDTEFARRERGVNLISIGDRWLLVGEVDQARAAYQEGLEIAKQLAANFPKQDEFQRDLSIGHDRLGDLHGAGGNAAEALSAYQEAHHISRELASRDPAPASQRDLWFSLDKLGSAYLKLGHTAEAKGQFEQALALAAPLAAQAAVEDLGALRDLAMANEKMGDIASLLGRYEEALGAYQRGMELGQRLARTGPPTLTTRRDLSVGYDKLGRAFQQLGRNPEALEAFEQARQLAKPLAQEAPERVQYQQDLALAEERVGEVQLLLGQAEPALAAFQRALEILRPLAEAHPDDAGQRFALSASLSKLGKAQQALERPAEALSAYQEALSLAQVLSQDQPSNAEYSRAVAVYLNKLGGAQLLLGAQQEADEAFAAASAITAQLARDDPLNLQAQRDLAVSHYQTMLLQRTRGDLAQWRLAAQQAVEGFERVYQQSEGDSVARKDLVNVLHEASSGLFVFEKPGAWDLHRALAWSRRLVELAGDNADHRLTLAAYLAMTGDKAGSAEQLRQALRLLPDNPEQAEKRRGIQQQLESLQQGS